MLGRMSIGFAASCAAVLFTGVLYGCGSDSVSSSRGEQLPTVRVISADNAYEPRDISVAVGQSIEWTNIGNNLHDIRIKKGPSNFGIDDKAFEPLTGTYSYAFKKTGMFVYYCTIHGTASGKGMAGTIKVTD